MKALKDGIDLNNLQFYFDFNLYFLFTFGLLKYASNCSSVILFVSSIGMSINCICVCFSSSFSFAVFFVISRSFSPTRLFSLSVYSSLLIDDLTSDAEFCSAVIGGETVSFTGTKATPALGNIFPAFCAPDELAEEKIVPPSAVAAVVISNV